MKKDNFVVFNSYIAKKLLQKGYVIVDLDFNKNDAKKTVFYFKKEGNIIDDFNEIKNYTEKIKNTL